jgi:dTDP-glucose pyrophosphorylase
MECIDSSGKGIALVVDEQRRLLGTITDGDIRRAVLERVELETPVQRLLEQRAQSAAVGPVTAPVGTSAAQLLRTMTELNLRHIPIVDDQDRVVALTLLSDLAEEADFSLRAVIMAGGYGTRLQPLTDELPKPMLAVGGRPLVERIVEQLRQSGIRKVNIATHYKREVIARHFGDGQNFGVDIRYVHEDHPLGTAGALSLLEDSDEPLLVINGDILTRVDFRAMLNFHRESQAEVTVGVREFQFEVPYGVVETDGIAITRIAEKPTARYFVNAGIYLLHPRVPRSMPNGQHRQMTDLINQLVADGRRVVSFPVREYWLDIGQAEQYHQAEADVATGRF